MLHASNLGGLRAHISDFAQPAQYLRYSSLCEPSQTKLDHVVRSACTLACVSVSLSYFEAGPLGFAPCVCSGIANSRLAVREFRLSEQPSILPADGQDLLESLLGSDQLCTVGLVTMGSVKSETASSLRNITQDPLHEVASRRRGQKSSAQRADWTPLKVSALRILLQSSVEDKLPARASTNLKKVQPGQGGLKSKL